MGIKKPHYYIDLLLKIWTHVQSMDEVNSKKILTSDIVTYIFCSSTPLLFHDDDDDDIIVNYYFIIIIIIIIVINLYLVYW